MILKKPKFWDYKKPNFFSYCLFPFTLIVELTNLIKKLKKPKEFKIKAIRKKVWFFIIPKFRFF